MNDKKTIDVILLRFLQ